MQILLTYLNHETLLQLRLVCRYWRDEIDRITEIKCDDAEIFKVRDKEYENTEYDLDDWPDRFPSNYKLMNISLFKNLVVLICTEKKLYGINKLQKLKVLSCVQCEIPLIDLPNLEELYCSYTKMKKFDHLTNLKVLDCAYCPVRKINLLHIEELYCEFTKLKKVDHLTTLRILNCVGTNIKKIPNNLVEFYCDRGINKFDCFENLEILAISNYDYLDVTDKPLKTFGYLPKLRKLYCSGTNIKAIEINHLTTLEVLKCDECNIEYLDLPLLRELSCSYTLVKQVSHLPLLEKLTCIGIDIVDYMQAKKLSWVMYDDDKILNIQPDGTRMLSEN